MNLVVFLSDTRQLINLCFPAFLERAPEMSCDLRPETSRDLRCHVLSESAQPRPYTTSVFDVLMAFSALVRNDILLPTTVRKKLL